MPSPAERCVQAEAGKPWATSSAVPATGALPQERTGCVPVLAGSGSTWFVEGAFPGEGLRVVRTARP